MRNLFLSLAFVLSSFLNAQTIQEADISIPILVYDNSGNPNSSRLLYCGIDSLATDSIDTFLGKYWLYCPWDLPGFETDCIPYDHFEAVLDPPIEPDPLSFIFGTWKDFRQGVIPYSGIKTYKIACLVYEAATAVYISWDFPEGVSGVIQDGLNGLIFTYQLPVSGSFTHPALIQLGNLGFNLILTFQNVIPAELISFNAIPQNNSVNLNWQTATETNNQGFAIERKQVFSQQSSAGNEEWNAIGFVSGNGTTFEPQSYSFVDENLISGKYKYRLKQIDYDGTFTYSNEIEVEISPGEFALEQNYPNPFNPSTSIYYSIGSKQLVQLKVYDVLGNEIATLVNEEKPSGMYNVQFTMTNLPAGRQGFSSGVYFYKLQAGELVQTKKMILLK
ncbi:MAG: T9SS type A sorting domain-containing protein [Ignavibacteriales bacterium]|nr:T9SS type A sorting domain-containing protein [Ignavibacteriales bacterium]